MSELINRRVVNMLESDWYPTLPDDIKNLLAIYEDPFLGKLHGLYIGHLSEQGASGVRFPAVCIWSEQVLEALTRGKYAHVNMTVDTWVSGDQASNYDGRRVVSILVEYLSRQLQDTNWSGDGISVKRCYETSRSPVVFEPDRKLYHVLNVYRVEATSSTWY